MGKSIKDVSQLTQAQIVLLNLAGAGRDLLDALLPPRVPQSALVRTLLGLSVHSVHRTVLHRLERRRFIKGSGRNYLLTSQGRRYANELVSRCRNQPAGKWDGKWRFLIFDVPENRKRDRDTLRRLLQVHNFRKLQASVWVTPYDIPADLHEKIWAKRLKYHIFYLLVSKVDYDRPLQELFPELRLV